MHENSGVVVLQCVIAPDSIILSTSTIVFDAIWLFKIKEPFVFGWPVISSSSLIATGIPSRGRVFLLEEYFSSDYLADFIAFS